jgi:hypothetical protein
MRTLIFLSHANPEDNEATRWFALQLTKRGYAVWSDITGFTGGEDFWNVAEKIIRKEAVKFVFLLSEASNHKNGPQNELSLALNIARNESLENFVIPIRIDGLPYDSANIQIGRKIIIDGSSWSNGLLFLCERLRRDKVVVQTDVDLSEVADVWAIQHGAIAFRPTTDNSYYTNWFPIRNSSSSVHLHRLMPYVEFTPKEVKDMQFPAVIQGRYILTFLNRKELEDCCSTTACLESSMCLDFWTGEANGIERIPIRKAEFYRLRSQIARMAWEQLIKAKKMSTYRLANGVLAYYFTERVLGSKSVVFRDADGKQSRRALCGKAKGFYWHYGLDAKLTRESKLGFRIRPHVFFSRDGQTPLVNSQIQHRLRRSKCRNWWNEKWRDMQLAAMNWLADGDGVVRLPVTPNKSIEVNSLPIMLVNEPGYSDPASGIFDLGKHSVDEFFDDLIKEED